MIRDQVAIVIEEFLAGRRPLIAPARKQGFAARVAAGTD
jgi:hypothetical protein